MKPATYTFPKAWMEECATAALRIRDHFGIDTALGYLVGEKFVDLIE
jgi:hypothetical protein